MDNTHLCKCGCGQKAKRLVGREGWTHSWKAYAAGHAPNETKVVKIPESAAALAYAAGIIDGEGCIHAAMRSRPSMNETRVQLQVAMCSAGVIMWLKQNFGGRTYTDVPKTGHTAYKRRYVWQISSRQVAVVLRPLLPYLIEKQERAKLAIQLAELIGVKGHNTVVNIPHRLSDEQLRQRTELASKIKFFNRRTTSEEDQPIELVGDEYKTGYP